MPNPAVATLYLELADNSGFYKFKLDPGTMLDLAHDHIRITTPAGSFPIPLANPGPVPDLALLPDLQCPTAIEGVGSDGVPTLTIPAGAPVTLGSARLQWEGKLGDAPPSGEGLDGLFTKANRVDAA